MRSLTVWKRLEPRTRNESLDGISARIADPLWLLGRQWQVGEFLGEDAGSLVGADLTVEADLLARYRPGDSGTGEHVPDPAPPLEAVVESERVRPDGDGDERRDHRLAAEAGSHFLRLLSANGHDVDPSAFAEPDWGTGDGSGSLLLDAAADDENGDRYVAVVGGNVPDGDELYDVFEAAGEDDTALPVPVGFDRSDADAMDDYRTAVDDYRRWYRELYLEPDADESAWDPDRMEYEFAVSTGSGDGETVFTAEEYADGRLDWYAFDADADATLTPEDAEGPDTESIDRHVVPTTVDFPGMPTERWWEFEDGSVNLGAVEGAPEDLSRLVMLEFALVYGNDWFLIPVDAPVGSLLRVTQLELTDTFGDTHDIDPAATHGEDPTTAWNMYGFPVGDEQGVLLAPTLVDALESDDVETLELARDELANVGWGIERTVESRAGDPLNRHEALDREPRESPPSPATDADVAYRLSTEVPGNWYPLLPERVDGEQIALERGRLLRDEEVPPPLGRLLGSEPAIPEEEVPRSGATVTRSYQRARATDRRTYLWNGRRKGIGTEESGSGLRYDVLEDQRAPTPDGPSEPREPTAVSEDARANGDGGGNGDGDGGD